MNELGVLLVMVSRLLALRQSARVAGCGAGFVAQGAAAA
jgi:hypothetical protein